MLCIDVDSCNATSIYLLEYITCLISQIFMKGNVILMFVYSLIFHKTHLMVIIAASNGCDDLDFPQTSAVLDS